jgi:hypothetical protein
MSNQATHDQALQAVSDSQSKAKPVEGQSLGKRASGRSKINFMLEAQRLKFSELEMRELERIYGKIAADSNPMSGPAK